MRMLMMSRDSSRSWQNGRPPTMTARVRPVFTFRATTAATETRRSISAVGSFTSEQAAGWGRARERLCRASAQHTRKKSRNFIPQRSPWAAIARVWRSTGTTWKSIRAGCGTGWEFPKCASTPTPNILMRSRPWTRCTTQLKKS